MYENIFELNNKFLEINRMGWIRSRRKGFTGIGYTFESLLGKNEDSLSLPDFKGIEIKTHRKNSFSYISLFNYNPIGDSSYELLRLFNNYSYLHPKDKNIRFLCANVFCNYVKDVGMNYKFSLKVDELEKKVFLLVYDRCGNLIEKNSYWSFETLKEKLFTKMRFLAYVEANCKVWNGCEYFKYDKITFYTLKDFDSFINLIKIGKIRVSFFISGAACGTDCINTHGASFSIKTENLNLLFDPISVTPLGLAT